MCSTKLIIQHAVYTLQQYKYIAYSIKCKDMACISTCPIKNKNITSLVHEPAITDEAATNLSNLNAFPAKNFRLSSVNPFPVADLNLASSMSATCGQGT